MVLGHLIFCFLVVCWAFVLEARPLVTEVEESIGNDSNSRRGSGDSFLLLPIVWLSEFMVLACMFSVSKRASILWCCSWLKLSAVSPTGVTIVRWMCFPACPHCVLDWWMRNPLRFLHTFPQCQVASADSPVKVRCTSLWCIVVEHRSQKASLQFQIVSNAVRIMHHLKRPCFQNVLKSVTS